jgi:hypothetical protein
VVRRTVSLPDSVDALVRGRMRSGESYSGAVAQLIEAGAAIEGKRAPRCVASGEGPRDLGRLAEKYLREMVVSR